MPIGRNRIERDVLTSKIAKLYGETGRFASRSGSQPCFGLMSISLESTPPKTFFRSIPNKLLLGIALIPSSRTTGRPFAKSYGLNCS